MVAEGFLEVETPMMHSIPGGAAARPFKTHHNALDMELFLRIAPELYLKRLVVGGMEKVFEINRNFRNEGMSTRHNPEFTMMEMYCAYEAVEYMMDLTERVVRNAARSALGTEQVTYLGTALDLGKTFTRLPIPEAIRKFDPNSTTGDLRDRGFLASRVKAMIVTHGADGSVIIAGGESFPIPPVTPECEIDPTGCGDACRSGLLYGTAPGWDGGRTGRAAETVGMTEVFKDTSRRPSRIAFPTGVTGLIDEISTPAYSAAIGLLLYGTRSESYKTGGMGMPMISGFKVKGTAGKLGGWLRSFVP